MKETVMYCHKRPSEREECGFWYNDFFTSAFGTKLCDANLLILEVKVREVKDGDTSSYWGWWNNEEQRFTLVYLTRGILSMCFPYGIQPEVDLGRGQDHNVFIEEVRDLDPKDLKF